MERPSIRVERDVNADIEKCWSQPRLPPRNSAPPPRGCMAATRSPGQPGCMGPWRAWAFRQCPAAPFGSVVHRGCHGYRARDAQHSNPSRPAPASPSVVMPVRVGIKRQGCPFPPTPPSLE